MGGGMMAPDEIMQGDQMPKVTYVCGRKLNYISLFIYLFVIECGKKNELAPGAEEIKCKSCSGRIFYKVR